MNKILMGSSLFPYPELQAQEYETGKVGKWLLIKLTLKACFESGYFIYHVDGYFFLQITKHISGILSGVGGLYLQHISVI